MDSTNIEEAAALHKYYDVKRDTEKLTNGLISILTSAIKLENIKVKQSATETLLSTDIGSKAVEQLLADNDPAKFPDGTREKMNAANFSREVRKAIQHVKPDYTVEKVIRHKNDVVEQSSQIN